MTKTIRKHLGDFLAILALLVLGLGVGAFILHNQRLRFPLIQDKPYTVKVELPDAQAVQPGQGQTVRTAGVEIGQIGKVELKDGKALVEMQLERKYKNYIKRNATVLLRTKTGLKDMFLEVDPGTGKPVPENGIIRSANAAPDIDPDEILSALDRDSRDYLKLLVSGAGKGLKGRGSDLQETFARLGPLNRDLAKVTKSVSRRRSNLKTLVHNYGLLTQELGTKDKDIVRLVRSSNQVFEALGSDDAQISETVRRLPGTLNTTSATLAKVNGLGKQLGPTLEALRPPFRQLASANRQVLPFVREATPTIKNQIRPFTREAIPFTRDLGTAAGTISKATPDLVTSFSKLNRLFNIGAFNPNGAEGLTGNPQVDRERQEGYLYWLGWLGQNTVSLFSTSDAQGPIRRISTGGVNCSIFTGIGLPSTVSALLGTAGVCTP